MSLYLNEGDAETVKAEAPLAYKRWQTLKAKARVIDGQIREVEAELQGALAQHRWCEQKAKLLAEGWREIPGTEYVGHMDDQGRVASLCDRKNAHWPLKVLMSTGRLKGSTKLAPVLVPPEVLRAVLA